MSQGSTVNALVDVIDCTGRDAPACFFREASKHSRSDERAWVNTDISHEDTTATCEIKNLGGGVFSATSAAVLCLAVQPADRHRSFPTLCVVCLATASQRLDSIAAREVVLKEWRLDDTTEDRSTGVHRLLLPVRTIFNVASVISSERLTELTRLFLTLRFLGCVDHSNRHRIGTVRLTYILPTRAGGAAADRRQARSALGPSPASGTTSFDEQDSEVVYVDTGSSDGSETDRSPSPPPPCREGTVPRPADDHSGRWSPPTTVIEVSEGEEAVDGPAPQRAPPTAGSRRRAPIVAPTSPLLDVAAAAPPPSAPMEHPPPPPTQWMTDVDPDGFMSVQRGRAGAAGGPRHPPIMPREHVLSLHEQLRQRMTSASTTVASVAAATTLSASSLSQVDPAERSTGTDALARAAALLGTSRRALWERASSNGRDGGSRCSSRGSSQDPQRDLWPQGLASSGLAWGRGEGTPAAAVPEPARALADDVGGGSRLSHTSCRTRVSVSTQTEDPEVSDTHRATGEASGRLWRSRGSFGEDEVGGHRPRPHLGEPPQPVGRFPVRVTLPWRYVDPGRPVGPGRVRGRGEGRLPQWWGTTDRPERGVGVLTGLRRPRAGTGGPSSAASASTSLAVAGGPRSTSPFVPAVRLRGWREAGARPPALADVSADHNRAVDKGAGSALEVAEEERPRWELDAVAWSPRRHRDALVGRESQGAVQAIRPSAPAEPPSAQVRSLSPPPDRSLLTAAAATRELEDTPMGTADKLSPLAAPATAACEAVALWDECGSPTPPRPPPLSASGTGSPPSAVAQPVVRPALADTYWICSEPQAEKGGRRRASGRHRHRRMGAEWLEGSGSPAGPPPLPLQGSPAARQGQVAGAVLCCSSFLVLKHHASRRGVGRRILMLQRGPLGEVGTSQGTAPSRGLRTAVSLRKLRGSVGTGASSKGECRVELGAEEELEVLTGLLAYHSGAVHQSLVRNPACCLVLRCNRKLVAAVELEAEEDLRLATSILTASIA